MASKTEDAVRELVDEPAAKRAKTEEKSKETELDALADKRPKLQATIGFETHETTMNVLPTAGGRLLTALSDCGMQYLVAGARGNVGAVAGRYFYEVRLVEAFGDLGSRGPRGPMPRQLVRLGFSTAGSSLVLGDGEGGICFDAEGSYIACGKRICSTQRFSKDQVLGLLLNLDAASPNANTLSLFRNGERITEPQAIPEVLRGKALFPHVSYRNCTLHVHFGPSPMKSLPFKCRMLQDAAARDMQMAKKVEAPKDGKYEVLFPVGIPNEGTFDWLDWFLAKHPEYVELSDRKIVDWAAQSGIWKGRAGGWKNSRDKPEFNFGIQALDDFSVKRILNSIVPIMPRNYVVMEVKENLVEADRKENLKRFNAPGFRKVAHIVCGEPDDEFKQATKESILRDKKSKAEALLRAQKVESERKKILEAKQQAGEAAGPEVKAEDSEVKQEKTEVKTEGVEVKKEDEIKKEEPEVKMEVDEKKEGEDEVPSVELTPEEESMWFKPNIVPDLVEQVFTANISKFGFPSKDEGFDEIRCQWKDEAANRKYFKDWLRSRKLVLRVEDLQPSEEFQQKWKGLQTKVADWQNRQRTTPVKEEDPDDEDDSSRDMMSIENVCDIGDGVPLFSNFGSEDWLLFNFRLEMTCMIQAFKKDAKDEEREIHESHMAFYYSKYFKKPLNPKIFGKETVREALTFIEDTVTLDTETGVLSMVEGRQEADQDVLVKLTEERRRDRQRRLDAGDETVRLQFPTQQQAPPVTKQQVPPATQQQVPPVAKQQVPTGTSAAAPGTGAPRPGTSAAAPGTVAPRPGTSAAAPGTVAPRPGTSAAAPGTVTPPPPPPSLGTPANGAQAGRGLPVAFAPTSGGKAGSTFKGKDFKGKDGKGKGALGKDSVSPAPAPAGKASPAPAPAGKASPAPAAAGKASPAPAAAGKASPAPAAAGKASLAPAPGGKATLGKKW